MIAAAAIAYLILGVASLRISDSWDITGEYSLTPKMPTALYLLIWPLVYAAIAAVIAAVIAAIVAWNGMIWLSGRGG